MRAFGLGMLIAALACSAARSDDSVSIDAMQSLIGNMGFKQTSDVGGGTCRVTVVATEAEALKNVGLLQKFGLLNEDRSITEMQRIPKTTTATIALQFAPISIQYTYEKNPTADKCAFIHNMIADDLYGNPKTITIFTYNFDRATFAKINWSNFKSQNLNLVARNFTFGPELARQMNEEASK